MKQIALSRSYPYIIISYKLGALMKKMSIIVLFLLLTVALMAQNTDPTPVTKPTSAITGEFLRVSLQVERPGLREALSPCYQLAGQERRELAVAILKEYSSTAQKPVLDEINELSENGMAELIGAYYLGGTISFYGTPGAITEIAARNDVLRVIDDSPTKLIEFIPSENPFQRPYAPMGITWSVDTVNANDAWATGHYGDGVIVGILDTGVRYTHVDLAGHMWINEAETPGNGVDDDYNGYIDDIYGYDFANDDGDPADDHSHGTCCAGLVAGNGTSSTDTTGIAPAALIMAIKVMDGSGSGSPAGLIAGAQYGVDAGAQVLSASLGWENPSDSLKDYFREAFEDIYATGIVVATAAGNEGAVYSPPQSIASPGDCPSPSQSGASSHTAIISVGATGQWNNITSFSSRGPTHWDTWDYSDFPYPPGMLKPELCAPGYSITTTAYYNDYAYTYDFEGTSASAPIVAGAIALALGKNPALTPEDIDTLLRNTALDLGTAGHDNSYGAGRLDCYALINAVPIPTFPILRVESSETDDSPPTGDGSGIFDAGEQVKLIIEVRNVGATSSVTGTASSTGDPNISVIDASGSWGALSTGTSAENTADPFVIEASSVTPPGYTADIEIELTASGHTFVETVQVSVGEYPREYASHTTPTLSTTVTNFGSFGFFNPPSTIGDGFEYGGAQPLYSGGFFLGLGYSNVITGENGNASEFVPIMHLEPASGPGDDYYFTSFIDPNTSVLINQRSITFDTSPDQDYIILKAIVKNRGTSTRTNMYIGFYLDFDIHAEDGPVWFDRATWVPANDWGYMWETGSTPVFSGYVGLVGLEETNFGSVIQNSVYVYPEGMGWDDTVKYNFLSGAFAVTDGSPEADWSIIASTGPFTLAPWEDYLWAVAVVAGDNLPDWQTNATAAITKYTTLDIDESELPKLVSLSVNPNPFNASCAITAPVGSVIAIYDMNGRRVRTFDPVSEGSRKTVWDGADQSNSPLPSGIYLIKASGGDFIRAVLLR